MFIGNYKYSIDDKNRLTIPAKLREDLGSVVFVSVGLDRTLSIRTNEQFNDYKQYLLDKSHFSKDVRTLQRTILGNTFKVELDKAGRILLSKDLIRLTDIVKDVTLVGSGDKIEIFSTESWNDMLTNIDSGALEDIAEKLDGKL